MNAVEVVVQVLSFERSAGGSARSSVGGSAAVVLQTSPRHFCARH